MVGRRSAGEGGIYQDVRRGLWIYQVSYKEAQEGRKRKKFAAKTKQAAMEKGNAFLLSTGVKMDTNRAEETVSDWVDEWLEKYAKLRLRPRTVEKYKSTFKCYILPQLGLTRLCDLNMQQVQKHFNSLLMDGRMDGKGLAPSTVNAARRYFAQVIDDAIREGILMKNPVRMSKAPRIQRKEIVVLDKFEIDNLVKAAGEIDHSFMSVMMPELVSFTVRTGLRQGEVFGLKWEDVDFINGCIFVKRSLAHVVGKGAVFQETKTKASRRRVLLMPEDVEALKRYREWQRNYADDLGDMFEWHNLVFTSPFGAPISPTNFSRRYFKPLIKKCRIADGFTFHCLRHTHATLLLQQGVNPKIVQERLGHSSIKVTMDTYSHVLPDMQKQAVEALGRVFG
ncbi:tyrosine-type recombinase/integrase [Selenomonas ruminantium]|uniref:tyrosine-type recombinase/integrase n=1 Tax=Selenomonas ruminantium TaxID=971 RepID=UPI000ABF896F|nr:tyrosine-type recombinase/integrase [Selenomonas ruminantium]